MVVAADLAMMGSDRSAVAAAGDSGGTSGDADGPNALQAELMNNSEVPATVESPIRLSVVALHPEA
jgi:hypothetical protein